jgi:N-acetylmuramoyl-L-alanine amidase
MRWSRFACLALVLLPAALRADEKRITVYTSQTSYTLPVQERSGQDFVGLLEILEPLGSVSATTQDRTWRLRFNGHNSEFTDGATTAHTPENDINMPVPFRLENGRGFVSLSALPTVLSSVLGTKKVIFREAARRLFLGNVILRYSTDFNRSPSRLLLNFTAAVSPRIATEPGRLRMTFLHEPLVPASNLTQTFDDRAISSVSYSEANGIAELTVTGAAPLFASFSNEGRTITLSTAPQAREPSAPAPPPAVAELVPTQAQPAPTEVPPATTTTPSPQPGAPHRYFAVVDASHGGTERGEALSPTLAEKDLNLAFARALAQELQGKGVSALVLRDSDATLTLDQRAALANSAHPAIYIAVHTSSQGRGVRVFHALLPSAASRGAFQAWEVAQAPVLSLAQPAAGSIIAALRKHDVLAMELAAPLRPLNNLIAPAVAIEIAPNSSSVDELNSAAYQQSIAAGVAEGILAMRDRLESAR